MRIKVSATIPSSVFTSIWDDPTEAAQEYQRFAQDIWLDDTMRLRRDGIAVSVQVEIGGPDDPPKPGIELNIEPYVSTPETLDMMAKTREMLTSRDDMWDRWMKSPSAKALYRG